MTGKTESAVQTALQNGRSECGAGSIPAIPCLANRYDILECIGKGSQGEVYRARRKDDGSLVAVKVMHIKSVKNWKMYELFDREAKVLQTINIDGVAKFYEAIEDIECADPVSVIVQQFVDGHALSEFIKAHRRFLLSDIADIIIQLVTILDKLHRSKPPIIHRDIKPSNILLQDSAHGSKVWLIDFGAVANPQVKDGGSTVAGTYGYMAPEQLMGQPKPQSDLYSTAVLAFYLLTGIPPESIEIQDFRLLIDPHLQNLPFPVTVLLRQMLEPHIDKRLTDANTILKAFEFIKTNRFNELQALVHIGTVNQEVKWVPVTSYKQNGCVEQWDALSDAVPRKLPRQVTGPIKKGLSQIKRYTKSDFGAPIMGDFIFLRKLSRMRSITKENISETVAKIIGTFFALAMSALLCGMLFFTVFIMGAVNFVLVATTICMFALFIYIIKHIAGNMMKSSDMFAKVMPLLTYGRKTFATVTSIGFEMLHEHDNAYRPLWKVSYKFNPADDESSDDLVRFFYTRRDPEDLKPGDLIPCIYIIGNDELGEYVYSMPWPILKFDDIYLSYDAMKLATMTIPLKFKVLAGSPF